MDRSMRRQRCVFAVVLVLFAAACASTSKASAPPSITTSTTEAPARYPMTITASNGKVVLDHEPTRIVSLSASGTEDLYAVGAGHQVVAVDAFSKYPPGTPVTSLSEEQPNVEAIAKYTPDLVVLSHDANHAVSQLHTLGVPVLVEPPAANLSDAYDQIQQLADATGHSAQGRAVVAQTRSQIDTLVRNTPRPKRPLAVYHELDQTYYSATSRTFVGQIYALFGMTNIADSAHAAGDYPQLSAEYIISRSPDLIVLADTVCCGQTTKTVAARPGWTNIAAVKNGAVVAVDDSIASEWGPRVVLFAQAVAQALTKLNTQPS